MMTNPRTASSFYGSFSSSFVTQSALCALAFSFLLKPHLVYSAPTSLRGKVTGFEKLISEVYLESSKPEAKRWTWREPSPAVAPNFLTLSADPTRDICVAAFGAGGSPPSAPLLVKVTGGRSFPTQFAIAPGTRLQFKNADPFPHRLYDTVQTSWTKLDTPSGGTREWIAPSVKERTLFEVRDEYAPSVRTYIVVDPLVVQFAYPTKEGTFSFNIPDGTYSISAFFGGKQVSSVLQAKTKADRSVDLASPLALTPSNSGEAK